MSSTGRFRSDLIAAAAKAARKPALVEETATVAGTADGPYGSWLGRMQRTRGRHAAISKNLNSWASYKSWSERVRDSWDDEPPADGGPRNK